MLVFADEATSALDAGTEKRLYELLTDRVSTVVSIGMYIYMYIYIYIYIYSADICLDMIISLSLFN